MPFKKLYLEGKLPAATPERVRACAWTSLHHTAPVLIKRSKCYSNTVTHLCTKACRPLAGADHSGSSWERFVQRHYLLPVLVAVAEEPGAQLAREAGSPSPRRDAPRLCVICANVTGLLWRRKTLAVKPCNMKTISNEKYPRIPLFGGTKINLPQSG